MPDDTRSSAPALRLFLWSRAAIWLLALVVVLGFDGALNARRGEWDSSRLHELGVGGRRLGAVGQRLVPADRRERLLAGRRARRRSSRSTRSSSPALGRLLLGHYLLAGVLVSLAAGSAAFVLLYRLTCRRLGEEAARHTVLFLAVAPTSLFFGAVYSESLFLLLAVATFLLAERGRFWQAGAAAGLALLTRSAGVALLPALVVLAWRRARPAAVARGGRRGAAPLRDLPRWCSRSGSGSRSRSSTRRRSSGSGGSRPPGRSAGSWRRSQDRELLDLGVAFALIALGIVAWRRIGPAYGLYTLTSVALPLTFVSDKVPLWSMQRFAVVVFPAFMALATLVRSRRAVVVTATILAAGLCVYVVRWALWYWVA